MEIYEIIVETALELGTSPDFILLLLCMVDFMFGVFVSVLMILLILFLARHKSH